MANENISFENSIRPGSIIYGNVGYSMVLPVFYEVVSLTASGKSARIRRLETRDTATDGYGFQGHSEPIPGAYRGELQTRRIKVANWGWCDPYEYVSDGSHSYRPWDGEPKYFDHMD